MKKIKEFFQEFLASPFGSFAKVYIVAVLSLILENGSFEGIELKKLLLAALFATLPLLINIFNPSYKGYGINKSLSPDDRTE